MTGPTHLAQRLITRHRRLATSHEAGTSIIELLVAMVLIGICGSIFTGAIVTLYRTTDAAQAVTTSAQQNNQAYQSLDRTVRYASAISTPGRGSGTGDLYVELRNTTDGTERCTQLRVDLGSQQLQRRTWRASDASPSTAKWTPLASGITNGAQTASGSIPFTLSRPHRQVLTFNLWAVAGPASALRTSKSSFDLTAINSPITSTDATASGVCQQAGRP